MTQQIGRLDAAGIGKELPKGTAVTPTYWLDTKSAKLNPKIASIKDESARGRIETPFHSDIAKKWSEPELGGIVYDRSFGLLLLAALGSVSTTADSPEAGVNTHTFSVKQDNDHPALTIVGKDGVGTKAAPYAVLNTLSIEANAEQYAEFSATFIAKALTDATETVSRISENRFVPDHISVKIADDLSSLDSASAITVKNCKLNIEKNPEASYKLGSKEPEAINNGTFRVTGDLELKYEDETYFDLFEARTTKALRLTLENTDVTIGSASNPSITIDLARVVLEEWDRSNDLDGLPTQTIGFEAEFSVDDGEMISAVLVNTATSY